MSVPTHTPAGITSPEGTGWRVYDEHHRPPNTAPPGPHAVPPGSDPRVAHRLFIRGGDRLWLSVALVQDERADLAPGAPLLRMRSAARVGLRLHGTYKENMAARKRWRLNDPSACPTVAYA